MSRCLVFNPGSASLKFDLVDLLPGQRHARQATMLLSASIEEIGDSAQLLVFKDRQVVTKERCVVHSIADGTRFSIEWLRTQAAAGLGSDLELDFVGVRVVHGGETLRCASPTSAEVCLEVERLQSLAPLHNKSSLEILRAVREMLPHVPAFFVFDTAFHQTIPEVAWRYPIHRGTADRLGIRKFGFHGISHRYMLDFYAETSGKPVEALTLVSLHLESGSSVTAVRNGISVDNTMGMTPLEGLMMGTRSGSIDPGIIPFMVTNGDMSLDSVMELLNKKSGLLGIAGETLDTRILVKRNDPEARLALAMFAYRVRLAVGAYLALLGDAEAVLFGGGIGEDSPWLRAEVCAGIAGWGMQFDAAANERAVSGFAELSLSGSLLKAFAVPVEEGLQIAHECLQAFQDTNDKPQ